MTLMSHVRLVVIGKGSSDAADDLARRVFGGSACLGALCTCGIGGVSAAAAAFAMLTCVVLV